MSKASEIIDDALQYLGVSSALMPAEPDQQQRAFKCLRNLFYSLPTENIYLPMRRPASVQAELREPPMAKEALIIILARACAPYFSVELTQEKLIAWSRAMNQLRIKTGRRARTSYGSDVPMGSGNTGQCWGSLYFYPGDNQYQFTLYDEVKKGESKIYAMDFSDEEAVRNTTVTSVTWSTVAGQPVTIEDVNTTGSLSTARLTFTSTGGSTVRARAVFANGEIYDDVLELTIKDPSSAIAND